MLLPLVTEFKRRRVFRAIIGYGIAAFAVLQIAEPVMHGLRWPDAVLSYVVVALGLGFPIVVMLAWVFDVKDGRLERTTPWNPGFLHGPALVAALAASGLVAAAPGLLYYFFIRREPERAMPESATGASIAVLPFVNLSGDKESEYFSDGITEELINALSQVDGLRVSSRTSAFAVRGAHLDARQIGERLKVRTLLEGSVRREGSKVRIAAQLVNVGDDVHLWSSTYEREVNGVFALEDEIARSIAVTLRRKLLDPWRGPLVKPATANPQAHDSYMRARYFMEKRTAQSVRTAASHFSRAIDDDGSYALAFVGLAEANMLQSEYDLAVSAADVLPAARAAALRALQIDPDLAEAHTAIGWLSQYLFDWPGAERELRRALELKPDYPAAHHRYALHLSYRGRVSEATVHAEEALRLDPTAPILNNLVAITRVYARDFEGALAAFQRTFELDPAFAVSHAQLGGTYVAMGRFAEAQAELARGTDSFGERYRGLSYAFAGNRPEAIHAVERLEARASIGFLSPATRGLIWLAIGEKDRGYTLLREACAQHDWRLRDTKIHPIFDPLRKDERFHEILKCVHLE